MAKKNVKIPDEQVEGKVQEPVVEEPQSTQKPEASAAPESYGRPAVVRSPSGLNLRAGPGPSFEVGEVLPDGAEVKALPLLAAGPQGQFEVHVPGWMYIFTGKSTGWASSRFLRLED